MLQTYKGWLFIAVTALLLYGLIGNALTTARERQPPGLDGNAPLWLESDFPAIPALMHRNQ